MRPVNKKAQIFFNFCFYFSIAFSFGLIWYTALTQAPSYATSCRSDADCGRKGTCCNGTCTKDDCPSQSLPVQPPAPPSQPPPVQPPTTTISSSSSSGGAQLPVSPPTNTLQPAVPPPQPPPVQPPTTTISSSSSSGGTQLPVSPPANTLQPAAPPPVQPPTTTNPGAPSECGNGIKESGEICDYGAYIPGTEIHLGCTLKRTECVDCSACER